MSYQPTKLAKDKPRVTRLNGKLIAIGGEVKRTPPPPNKPRVIREATATEYKKLYNLGLTKLVEYVEPSESDTTTTGGSSEG